MVQRTENEEAEFKVPETLSLCVNNCGLSGNPTTNNLCESCFKATAGILKLRKFSSRGKPRLSTSRSPERSGSDASAGAHGCVEEEEKAGDGKDATSRKEVNRCSGCRRKVGLTGFRCRCGDLFCSEHRYSDRHVCSYDYKAAGREAIAQENPVVKAAKIVRI